MHCNLYVLKPKGCVVDTTPIYNNLNILSHGMIDYIGDDITEKELEYAVRIYDIANDKEKARERLEEIKGYIKKHLENDEVDTYTLNEACGAYVAIISDNGYKCTLHESELALDTLNNRLPQITDMEIAVFDYHQ